MSQCIFSEALEAYRSNESAFRSMGIYSISKQLLRTLAEFPKRKEGFTCADVGAGADGVGVAVETDWLCVVLMAGVGSEAGRHTGWLGEDIVSFGTEGSALSTFLT